MQHGNISPSVPGHSFWASPRVHGSCAGAQDPFELSHDLGRTVDRQTSMVLHKEFERAACILRDLPGGVDKLFEPYRAGKTE